MLHTSPLAGTRLQRELVLESISESADQSRDQSIHLEHTRGEHRSELIRELNLAARCRQFCHMTHLASDAKLSCDGCGGVADLTSGIVRRLPLLLVSSFTEVVRSGICMEEVRLRFFLIVGAASGTHSQ